MANEPDEVNPSSHRPPGPPQSPDENSPGSDSPVPADPGAADSESPKPKKEPRPPEDDGTDSGEDQTQPSAEQDLSGEGDETGAGQEEEVASHEEGALPSSGPTEEPAETDEFTEAGAEESSPHDDPHHHYHHDDSHEPAAESAVTAWDEEEEGGGPVKSFLEHLEDFRWTIIRCLAALVIGMVVCLVAGSKIVELLKKPLYRAQQLGGKIENPVILFQAGTNVWPINLTNKQFGPISLGTNLAIKLVMQPIQVGTNMVLALKQEPVKPEEIPVSYQITLKNLGPVSPFVVAIKIALFGGIGLASPFILLFVGQFVVPALRKKEKKYLFRAVFIGAFLFCCGVLFCYFLMLQVALNAAVQFSRWMNFDADIWRAEEYISFVVKFMLGMGLSFELPVVLLTLVKLELIDYHTLTRFRPYWVIVNLVIAAVLTPPDVVSQLLMAIPLQVLFEVSVLIAWYWHRRDQKRREREFGTA